MNLSNYLNKDKLTFKLTEDKNGALSTAIDKIVKAEALEKAKNPYKQEE